MRKRTLSVLATGAMVAVLLSTVPAHAAADGWFAPHQRTDIDNGSGPGPAPRGTAAADFNGDGKPDLVTVDDYFGAQSAGIVLGHGDGTFGDLIPITGASGAEAVDAGDINQDGNDDVIVATTSEVLVFFGDGAGGFTSGGSYPMSLGGQVHPRLADLTGNGRLDIVAPSFTAIQTLLNNGDSTFTPGPTTRVPGAGALSAISPADLDGDGHADLFAVDGFSGATYALRGHGDGRFTVTGQLYGSGFVPEDVAAIDLDGDGYDDAAVIGSFSFTLTTGLTDGSGTFRSPYPNATQYGGSGPTSLTAADFDGDGRTDLAVSYLLHSQPAVKVLAGDGTPTMRVIGDFPVAQGPQNPVVADFDGDGTLDIVTAGPGALSLLRNTTP